MGEYADRLLWEKVTSFVEKEELIQRGDRILLGLSGGADSVCLARYLLAVRKELGTDLLAVHVNHGIRGSEADRDECFVKEFCSRWGITLKIIAVDVPGMAEKKGLSLEEAGRISRYETFDRVALDCGCSKIAVAHHANDLAETMLFRMVRGTGPFGLAAMTARSGSRIRPLLCLTRKEIEEILNRLGQNFVEDSSNRCTDYSRNYIRHQTIPGLEAMNPGFIEHMKQLAFMQAEQNAYLEEMMDRRLCKLVKLEKGRAWIDEEAFKGLLPFEKKEVLRRMLFHVSGRRKDIGHVHIRILEQLMSLPAGKRSDLPYGVMALRLDQGLLLTQMNDGSRLAKERDESEMADPGLPVDLKILEREGILGPIFTGRGPGLLFRLLEWGGQDVPKSRCVKYFDYDKINSALIIRPSISGDYFFLDTLGRRKKVRRYFIDEKIPLKDRGNITVLAEGNHVLWIPGHRSSEGCRVNTDTRRVLRVEMLTQEQAEEQAEEQTEEQK